MRRRSGVPAPAADRNDAAQEARQEQPVAWNSRRRRATVRRMRGRIAQQRVPAVLVPVLRAIGVSVADVAHYWSEEKRSLRRGVTVILLTSVTGMVAGITLAGAEAMLERLPGLLVLVPAAIGMRGNIYGALASRLATALHIGAFEPELRRHGFLNRQIEATTILSLGTSVFIAVVAWILGAALGLGPIPLWKLIVIATVGGMLASLVLLVVTIALAVVSQRRAWNMDDVGAPTVTAFGDMLTIPALLLAAFLVAYDRLSIVLGVLLAGFGVWALFGGWRHHDDQVRRIVRESIVTLAAASVMGVLAGSVLQARLVQWVSAPVLLVMIPAFVANCGSLGGILSSRISSKLYLGLLEPRPVPERLAGLDISVTFLYGLVAFTAIGTTAWIAATIFGHAPPPIWTVLGITILAGLLSTVAVAAVAYTTATLAYRHDLDPDNQGIPIVTSVMDLLGLLCLLGVASIWIN